MRSGQEKGAEPEPSTSFKDVAADAWYAEYVSYLAGKGIVNGKTADTFAPDAQITRAEFIKIIAGVAGADVSGKSSSRFSDVASDAWYVPYVHGVWKTASSTVRARRLSIRTEISPVRIWLR